MHRGRSSLKLAASAVPRTVSSRPGLPESVAVCDGRVHADVRNDRGGPSAVIAFDQASVYSLPIGPPSRPPSRWSFEHRFAIEVGGNGWP
jgi:hypothetical protein